MLAENQVPYDNQAERLNKVVSVLQRPIFKETIFDNGRRVALQFDGEVLELNTELLSRVSDADMRQAFAAPISKILQVSQLNIGLLFQSNERFKKNIVARLKRAQKEYVKATEIESFVVNRTQIFESRVNQVTQRLTSSGKVLKIKVPNLVSTMSWPDWEDIEDLSFTNSVENWLNEVFLNDDLEKFKSLLPKLVWDSLSLTKQSALKNVGRNLRTISLSSTLNGRVLSAFASVLFSDNELCLKSWPAFEDVINAFTKVVQRERQLFGVAWNSDIGVLDITRSAGDLFGFSEPSELPWLSPVVCWSQREIVALRDLLIGVDKTLPSHVLMPFGGTSEVTNDILQLTEQIPMIGVKLGFPSNSTPSYNHNLSSVALNASRNLIISRFFRLSAEDQETTVLAMRNALETQYPHADMVWKRRFHRHEKLSLEEKFVDLVNAFIPLMDLPVLFDPFRSPDLATIASPTAVFILGVNDAPFKFSFGVPIPAILGTRNENAVRIRIVKVSTEKKSLWWGDKSVHISKLVEQSTESIMDATLGGGVTFIFHA